MTTKIRKQIYIEAEQESRLKQLAVESGLSEAELIRRAIDMLTYASPNVQRSKQGWMAELAYIDQLIAQGPVAGHRKWTREELHER